jgi:hypothetical protein
VAQALVRLHQHALGGDALGSAAGQFVQDLDRLLVAPVVEQQARLHGQPGLARVAIVAFGAREPLVAPPDLAQFARGARRDQRGESRRLAQLVGLAGRLLGAAKTPLEQGLQRGEQCRAPFLAAPARVEGAHMRRQAQRVRDQPQQQVPQCKAAQPEQDRKIERQLGAVRRKHEDRVAVIQMRSERQPHCKRKYRQHPHQAAHR